MTNLADLPHKTAYEACNPDHNLISEVQVAEDEGIKIVTLRQYSHASIKAAVGTRLDPVCKDEARHPLVRQRRRRGVEGQACRDEGPLPKPHADALPPPLTNTSANQEKKHHHGTHRR